MVINVWSNYSTGTVVLYCLENVHGGGCMQRFLLSACTIAGMDFACLVDVFEWHDALRDVQFVHKPPKSVIAAQVAIIFARKQANANICIQDMSWRNSFPLLQYLSNGSLAEWSRDQVYQIHDPANMWRFSGLSVARSCNRTIERSQ